MAKTKALISCAVTAQLICVFVFAYANCCFSHAQAQVIWQAGWERKEIEDNEPSERGVTSGAFLFAWRKFIEK